MGGSSAVIAVGDEGHGHDRGGRRLPRTSISSAVPGAAWRWRHKAMAIGRSRLGEKPPEVTTPTCSFPSKYQGAPSRAAMRPSSAETDALGAARHWPAQARMRSAPGKAAFGAAALVDREGEPGARPGSFPSSDHAHRAAGPLQAAANRARQDRSASLPAGRTAGRLVAAPRRAAKSRSRPRRYSPSG
jgi:hypothetical protein